MSKSAYLEEDSSWAQTFFTVTPQDDGFLREIEDTTIISGNADVGLNLGSWNIVLRRPLADTTTKDFIELRELEKPELTATECQTYLQGVPRVDLPLVYRDEAMQTLYMGKDEKAPFEKAFDDIITVMNDKQLPEWKKSEQVQTKITVKNDASLDDIIEDLETDGSGADDSESDPMISAAAIESADAMNFLVDRALWMSEPVATSKFETKDAEIETMIKFNHASKKLTVDHEVQTDLSCEPKFSNSMLLSGYNEARGNFEQSIERNLAGNVKTEDSDGRSAEPDSEGIHDDELTDFGLHGVEANLEESVDSNLPSPENLRTDVSLAGRGQEETGTWSRREPPHLSRGIRSMIRSEQQASMTVRQSVLNERSRRTPRSEVESPAENYRSASCRQNVYEQVHQSPSLRRDPQKTEEILLTDEPSYVSRNLDEAAGNQYLNRACPSRLAFRNHPRSINLSINSQISHEASSSSLHSEGSRRTGRKSRERKLPAGDEEALQTLKHTFCTKDPCAEEFASKNAPKKCNCSRRSEMLWPNE